MDAGSISLLILLFPLNQLLSQISILSPFTIRHNASLKSNLSTLPFSILCNQIWANSEFDVYIKRLYILFEMDNFIFSSVFFNILLIIEQHTGIAFGL